MRPQFPPGVRPPDVEHGHPRGFVGQVPFSPRSQQQVEPIPGHATRYPFSPGSHQQQQLEPGSSRGYINRFPFSPGSHRQQTEQIQPPNYVNRHPFSPESQQQQQQQYPMQMNPQMRQAEFFQTSGNFRMAYNSHQTVNQRPVNHITQPSSASTRSPPFPHGPNGNHDYPTLTAALQKPQPNQQMMQQFNHSINQGITPGSIEDRRLSVNSPASQASVESGSGKRKRISEDDPKESGAVKKPKNNVNGNFYKTTIEFLRSKSLGSFFSTSIKF